MPLVAATSPFVAPTLAPLPIAIVLSFFAVACEPIAMAFLPSATEPSP